MTRARGIRRALRAAACIVFLVPVLASCTRHALHSPYIKRSLAGSDFPSALERLEKINNRSSTLLYLYEKGLVLHYQGDLEASNLAFHAAEDLYFDLYTKSLTREFASLVTSDNIIKYRGERYEAAMIHYYKVLNYLALGDPEGALVECRKLSNRLQMFLDDDSEHYVTDPFLHYFAGMVFQAWGETNDALVSFRLALKGFEKFGEVFRVDFPRHLYCDLAAAAERLHDYEAAGEYRERSKCDECSSRGNGKGIVNVFVECGYIPYRVEETALIPIYKNEIHDNMDVDEFTVVLFDRYGRPRNYGRKLDYMMKISVPSMVSVPFPYGDAEVTAMIDGYPHAARSDLLQNLDEVARLSFEEDFAKIVMKTMARTIAKKIAHEAAADKDVVAGWVVNLINIATETADTRSWTTLPNSIRVARLCLPVGTHDIDVRFYNAWRPGSERMTIRDVKVRAGRSTFVSYRTF